MLSQKMFELFVGLSYIGGKIIGHTGWLGQLTELTLEYKTWTVTRSFLAIENGKIFAWFFELLNGLSIY